MDTVSSKVRSKIMKAVKGKDTDPEIRVRKWLHANGFRYRLQYARLPGKPDIVMPGRQVAIFVHGCFWHRHKGCRKATFPKSRQDYWNKKFASNEKRDAANLAALEKAGWRTAIVWECALSRKESFEKWMKDLADWIRRPERGDFYQTGLD